MDKLTRMRVFVNVVEGGSFVAASDRLDISRAAASKYVSQLEEHLGARLLNRTTRHLSLTEPGRVYFEHCKEIFASLEEADNAISNLSHRPRGTLRISAPRFFASRHLLPIVREFNQRYPDVDVELMCTERFVDLVDEGFDLAIRIADIGDSDLVARRLSRCRHVFVAAPEYLDRHPAPATHADLQQRDCLVFSFHTGAVWHMQKDGQSYSVKVKTKIKTNSPDVLLEAVNSGMGIAFMPTFLIGDDLRAGRLVQVLEDYRLMTPDISAVYASRRHLPQKIRAFVELLQQRITDPPYWDVI